MESWKPVVGHEGRYEVSDQGRIRSLERLVPNGPDTYRVVATRLLKTPPDHYGYPVVQFSVGNRAKKEKVHLIVLEAFIGPRPDGLWGLHANDIKVDNRLQNLRWGTPAENTSDAKANGRWTPPPIGVAWLKRKTV